MNPFYLHSHVIISSTANVLESSRSGFMLHVLTVCAHSVSNNVEIFHSCITHVKFL